MSHAPTPKHSGAVLLAQRAAALPVESGGPRRRRTWKGWVTVGSLALLSTVFFLYLLVPIVALVFHAPPSEIWEQMKQPDVIQALKLSFFTTAISYGSRGRSACPRRSCRERATFPGHRLLEMLATLPTVLPPTVAGLALLLAYGRSGLVGQYL